jgi:hypothetical protein
MRWRSREPRRDRDLSRQASVRSSACSARPTRGTRQPLREPWTARDPRRRRKQNDRRGKTVDDHVRRFVSEGGLEPPHPIRALAPQASASAIPPLGHETRKTPGPSTAGLAHAGRTGHHCTRSVALAHKRIPGAQRAAARAQRVPCSNQMGPRHKTREFDCQPPKRLAKPQAGPPASRVIRDGSWALERSSRSWRCCSPCLGGP